jgi:protoporphyrinogen oxidase
MSDRTQAAVIGAGPAGCSAARTLIRSNIACTIIDKLDVPGGLARTIKRGESRFDVGPHRFFTRQDEVLNLWREVLGNDLTSVDRLTRILYRNKLFNYPLAPANALFGLGIGTSVHAGASYLASRLKHAVNPREPQSFEDWVTDHFGTVLYNAFFKHYTGKVWGIPCTEISADWASQRIKGLDLMKAVYHALFQGKGSEIKTLVDRFLYPRYGAGSLCEIIIDEIVAGGGTYIPLASATAVERVGNGWAVHYAARDGNSQCVTCDHVLSSMPVSDLVEMLSPKPPMEIREAAKQLRWRNHYGVDLLVKGKKSPFPDNWIYVHSPELHTARITNYANFSKEMQGARDLYPLTLEFFSFPGDNIAVLDDSQKIDLAIEELMKIGFLKSAREVEDAFVVFSRAAYAVMQMGYEQNVAKIRNYLDGLEGIQTMGRGGLFQYNNQDHSTMTGILAARNLLGGRYDVWEVNIDAAYQESGIAPDPCGC